MNDTHDTKTAPPSRRDFLRGASLSAAATAAVHTALPVAAEPVAATRAEDQAPAMGPGEVTVKLDVNGTAMTAKVEPRVTLLDALRNTLDVTGPKRVCDRGSCGACTVLLDGRPIYACTTLAVEAQGKKVKTAEALVDGDKLDAVPAAFVKYDAQQCGFCTPGFVVAIRAALDKNPNATPAEIEEACAGNICRCGTYAQMRDAITSLCKKGG